MTGTFSLCLGWLRLTLLIFVVAESYYLLKKIPDTSQQSKQWEESDYLIPGIEAKDYEEILSSGNDLVSNEFISRLPYPSIRTKAEELRDKYNRRAQMIRIIDSRKREFHSRKLINRDVVMRVNHKLQEEKKKNAAVKRHYEKIIAFAEMYAADHLISKNAEMLQIRANTLEKENDEFLRTLETTTSF